MQASSIQQLFLDLISNITTTPVTRQQDFNYEQTYQECWLRSCDHAVFLFIVT